MYQTSYIYIVTNKWRTTLYTGVTSDLIDRIWKHKEKFYPHSFSAKYKTTYLIYYETFDSIEDAISREKYIKGKSRQFKEDLVNSLNPSWVDLYEDFKKAYYGD
ncbi:MAG: GIY-YIG nuclease family protein [Chitinophagales bacterium]